MFGWEVITKYKDLEVLWLDDNSLSGEIPSELGNLSRLIWLTLSNNALHGSVPGRLLYTLIDENLPAGTYAITFDASGLSSGTYIYQIEADGQRLTRTMTLIR